MFNSFQISAETFRTIEKNMTYYLLLSCNEQDDPVTNVDVNSFSCGLHSLKLS